MKTQSISQENKAMTVYFLFKRRVVSDQYSLYTYILVQLDRCLCPTLLRD